MLLSYWLGPLLVLFTTITISGATPIERQSGSTHEVDIHDACTTKRCHDEGSPREHVVAGAATGLKLLARETPTAHFDANAWRLTRFSKRALSPGRSKSKKKKPLSKAGKIGLIVGMTILGILIMLAVVTWLISCCCAQAGFKLYSCLCPCICSRLGVK